MTGDDAGFFEWAFKSMVGLLFTVGGWFYLSLNKNVNKNRDELADHKLHVSENYAKKTDIRDVFNAIDEVRKDIKTLLIRGGHNDR